MTQDSSKTVSAPEFRALCGRFATGVAVITARRDTGRLEGVTVNSFTSLSLDPPLVLFCLDKNAGTFPTFEHTRHFAVNILAADQRALSDRFAAIGLEDRFDGVDLVEDGDDHLPPRLAGTLGALTCAVEARHPGGDHTIIVGRVMEARMGDPKDPLIFFSGYREIAQAT